MGTFGDRLKDLREKRDLTQNQLAEKVGVTRPTIYAWEKMETAEGIRAHHQHALARELGVDLEYLIHGREPEKAAERSQFTPIPLIDFESLAQFIMRDLFPDLDIKKISKQIFPPPTVGTLSADAYAFVAPDDSLKEYPPGSLIIVDMKAPARPNKPIVAVVHGEPFLRIYNFKTKNADGQPVFSVDPDMPGHPSFSSEITDIRFGGSVRGHWEPTK